MRRSNQDSWQSDVGSDWLIGSRGVVGCWRGDSTGIAIEGRPAVNFVLDDWKIGFQKTVRVCAFGALKLSRSDAVELPSYRTEGLEVGQKHRAGGCLGTNSIKRQGVPRGWKSGARARASTCFKKIRCPSKHLDLGCDVDQPHQSASLSLSPLCSPKPSLNRTVYLNASMNPNPSRYSQA